jgi:hypothetical protein
MNAGILVILDNLDYLLWGRLAVGKPGFIPGVTGKCSDVSPKNISKAIPTLCTK